MTDRYAGVDSSEAAGALYRLIRCAVRDGMLDALTEHARRVRPPERDGASRLLHASEVAEILRLSTRRVYALMRERQLPCIRLGRTVRVPEDLLAEWMRRHRRPAMPPNGPHRRVYPQEAPAGGAAARGRHPAVLPEEGAEGAG